MLFMRQRNNNNQTAQQGQPATDAAQQDDQFLDLTPATDADNEEINKRKESDPAPPPTTPIDASVVLTRVSQDDDKVVRARAMVIGATEGTCTATFTPVGGGTAVTATGEVTNQGTQYGCGNMDAGLDKFLADGDYEVRISLQTSTGTTLSNNTLNVTIKR